MKNISQNLSIKKKNWMTSGKVTVWQEGRNHTSKMKKMRFYY